MSLLAMIAASSTLLVQADEVGLAYVDCMFTAARESESSLASEELGAHLRQSCERERRELHAVVIEIRREQGVSAEQAESEFSKLERDSIISITRARRAGARASNG